MRHLTRILPFAIVVLAACSAPPAASPAADGVPAGERDAGQEASGPLHIVRAFGTEPFWNIRVVGETLTYTTPEDPAGQVMQGLRRARADGVEIAGEHQGQRFVLSITAGECSDGMSDNRYALVARFRFGGVDYQGCGEAAE